MEQSSENGSRRMERELLEELLTNMEFDIDTQEQDDYVCRRMEERLSFTKYHNIS